MVWICCFCRFLPYRLQLPYPASLKSPAFSWFLFSESSSSWCGASASDSELHEHIGLCRTSSPCSESDLSVAPAVPSDRTRCVSTPVGDSLPRVSAGRSSPGDSSSTSCCSTSGLYWLLLYKLSSSSSWHELPGTLSPSDCGRRRPARVGDFCDRSNGCSWLKWARRSRPLCLNTEMQRVGVSVWRLFSLWNKKKPKSPKLCKTQNNILPNSDVWPWEKSSLYFFFVPRHISSLWCHKMHTYVTIELASDLHKTKALVFKLLRKYFQIDFH